MRLRVFHLYQAARVFALGNTWVTVRKEIAGYSLQSILNW
jgi:hypothetical protein